MRACRSLLLALGLVLASAAPARAILVVTLNFDTGPDGTPIAPGTVLNATYQAWGITFVKEGPGTNCGVGTQIYANNDLPVGFGTAPNLVSTCAPPSSADISENAFGTVHALFAQGASMVSIDVRPDTPSDFAVLRAYDAADNLLATSTSAAGATGTLSVSSPTTPIRGVRFSGSATHFARFDNLKVYLVARLIDFDHDPLGGAIANGTNVGSTYLPWGVTFGWSGTGSACGTSIYAHAFTDPSWGSSPQRVSTCGLASAPDINETYFGLIHATFADPWSSVCIEVKPDFAADFAVLRAYDASDQFLSEVTSSPGVVGPLCISAPGIRGVRFSGAGTHFCMFDNLTLGWASLAGVEPGSHPTGLALGAPFPNPARGSFSVWCTIAPGTPAAVELLDVAGRRIERHALAGSGSPARVRFGDGASLAPGVYLVRLRQGGRSAVTRAALLR